MIKSLFNEFVKNCKIIFRNWVSLSLLIIAPVVMILLIGYAFSNEDLSGLNVGIVSAEKIDFSFLISNFSSSAELLLYDNIEGCISDLTLQRIHLCIYLEGISFGPSKDGSSGKVTYFYDNSRKRISLTIIQGFQQFFGQKAEQISIESAESIIHDIEGLVTFINDRKVDINTLRNESLNVKNDLINRGDRLKIARDAILPSYEAVKFLQLNLQNYTSGLENTSDMLVNTSNALVNSLNDFKEYSSQFMIISESLENNTNITVNYSNIANLVDEVISQVSSYANTTNNTVVKIKHAIDTIDAIVSKLDLIKGILDDEIVRNDEYIIKIDSGLSKVNDLSLQLDKKISQLATLHPNVAEKLARPIVSNYSLLLKDAKNIQLAFPQLCVIIIMFISLLFANITTLIEIHSKARLRNVVAPTNDLVYTFGLWFTSVIIIFFQVLVLFFVAQSKFGVNVIPIFWQLCLITVLLVSIFALIGMLLAFSFNSIQSSILMTTFVAIFFFIFGNTLSPLESMPAIARVFANFNPLIIGESLIRQVQLFGTNLSLLLPQIYLLVIFVCILLIAVILVSKFKNKS